MIYPCLASLLASVPEGELVREWNYSGGELLWQASIILFFVLLNGFFVASEFALVKVRDSQIEAAADDGAKGAALARHETRHLDS